ncbi:OLC1v1025072C1 [Oldenlandia corymbosa var. corymbosa]|uniref:OLC1v1025072C1 n=1 Tax=Oldenlandia corymbosa var. corymbosa TaxID=529605 RepID=A0AAV1C4J7_OLDCO|nr:OLC1v1025072C1 [Oldenlandia corymbosa var. corymbosa]
MDAMASQLYYTSPAKFPLPRGSSTQRAPFLRQSQRIRRTSSPSTTKILASGGKGIDLLGDFGAIDYFPAEIESSLDEKVIWNFRTEHKILIPNVTALSLKKG